jgi:hypothetical protein
MTGREERPPVEQEDDVLPRRLVLGSMAAAAVFAVVLSAWSCATTRAEEAKARPSRSFPEREVGSLRRDDVHDELFARSGEGRALLSRQQAELSTYGWVDRDAGVCRIPIEDAIEALAEDSPR